MNRAGHLIAEHAGTPRQAAPADRPPRHGARRAAVPPRPRTPRPAVGQRHGRHERGRRRLAVRPEGAARRRGARRAAGRRHPDGRRGGRPARRSRPAGRRCAPWPAGATSPWRSRPPTATTATVARRGVASWSLQVKGRTGHSSGIFGDDSGAGAIFETARILDEFRRELSGQKGLTFNPSLVLGGTTAAYEPGTSGGKAEGKTNVIPGEAYVHGDLRFLTDAQCDAAVAAMRAIVARNLPRDLGRVRVRGRVPRDGPDAGQLCRARRPRPRQPRPRPGRDHRVRPGQARRGRHLVRRHARSTASTASATDGGALARPRRVGRPRLTCPPRSGAPRSSSTA